MPLVPTPPNGRVSTERWTTASLTTMEPLLVASFILCWAARSELHHQAITTACSGVSFQLDRYGS